MTADKQLPFTQEFANLRVWQGNPNGYVYGLPGWTCQDWTNGALYVCQTAGLSGWTLATGVTGSALYTKDFGTLNPNDTHDLTFAFAGAQVNDIFLIGLPPAADNRLQFSAFCPTVGNCTLRCFNNDGGMVTTGALTFRLAIQR